MKTKTEDGQRDRIWDGNRRKARREPSVWAADRNTLSNVKGPWNQELKAGTR